MACLYFPNGVWEKTWFPIRSGRDFDLPFALEPLARHQASLTVFSGLDKRHSHGGDGHYAKTANFLTGLPVRKTAGKDIDVGGLSIDQLCAQNIGRHTPLPSLELGIDPVISGIDSVVGYTRLYGCYISWRAPGQPVAREIHPRQAYERLFGVLRARNQTGKERGRTADEIALLDRVMEDASRLRGRLGRDDRHKLDEYLDSVRDVERRLEFFSKPDGRVWRPPTSPGEDFAIPQGEPGDHQEHVRLMLDLMALAFWTDSTRIATFMFANDVSGKNFGKLVPGTSGSHHEFSHHQSKAEKVRTLFQNQSLACRAACLLHGQTFCGARRGAESFGQQHGVVRIEHVGRQPARSGQSADSFGRPGGWRDQGGAAHCVPQGHSSLQPLRVDVGTHGITRGEVWGQHRSHGFGRSLKGSSVRVQAGVLIRSGEPGFRRHRCDTL